jgi:hypothetical protein
VSAVSARQPVHAAQAGIPVPDQFRYAEPFIRTLEAGGLVVQSIATTTLSGFLGGGQTAALITTDKGVVEVIVLPGALDAEQLSITYTKWNGNGHHFHIEGPSLRKPEESYGSQFAYFTLHKNWFIRTFDATVDGIIKRIFGQIPAR